MTAARPDVLLYTHSFSGGGAERCMVHLANHWKSQGRAVAFAVNVAEGPLQNEVAADVERIDLATRRGTRALPALVRLFRGRRPKAVLSTLPVQNMMVAVANVIGGRPTRTVVTEQTSLASKTMAERGVYGRLVLAGVRVFYPLADAVAAVSTNAARDLDRRLGRPAGSTAVVYNPVWPPATTPGLDAAALHPFFASGEPVLVAVGRLHPQKNHRNLLEALAIVRRTRPVRAVVIGEGPLRGELEAQVRALGLEGAADFPGFQRNVGDFLAAASLFVLSSDGEGLPLAMLEALHMGVPVVSTDCESGPRELLADGAYGRLAPIRDPQALAAAILAALDESPDRDRLRARAAEFSIDAIARRYEALLFPSQAVTDLQQSSKMATTGC